MQTVLFSNERELECFVDSRYRIMEKSGLTVRIDGNVINIRERIYYRQDRTKMSLSILSKLVDAKRQSRWTKHGK